MTPAAHYLSLAIAATFALPAARYDAFALACVAAARAHDVSACDVAALAIVDGDTPADVARSFAAARRRCGSRGLAVAGMRGACRDVAQRGAGVASARDERAHLRHRCYGGAVTPAALLAFMLSLVGGHDSTTLREYHAAILATDATPDETRVLAVVAHAETCFHATSRTPPFGLTERRQRGLRALTIAESAPVALRVLRYLRGRCASLGAPSWGAVLGRFHHGLVGVPQGCYPDRLALIEVRRAGVR